MKILVDIDNILVGTIDKKNKTGLYWTAYNIAGKMIENKLDVTFVTNKYTVNIFDELAESDKQFQNTKCISSRYSNIFLDKIITFFIKKRFLYKREKRNSTKYSLRWILNIFLYLIYSILFKIFNFLTSFSYNREILDFEIYQSLFYKIPKAILNCNRIRKFIFVHDILPLIRTRDFSSKKNGQRRCRGNFYEIFRNLDRNVTFICNSENTKKDLVEYFPQFKLNKIVVAPLAANKKQFFKLENEDIALRNKILQKYGIPIDKKYVLSLCSLNPRKNLIFLLDCFIKFLDDNKNIQDLYLVLAGPKGWRIDNLFSKISDCEKYKDRIILTGFLDESDINTVYNNAFCFVFPSLYEGFGLPVLEAMQCRVPVISSNTSSMPEVYGDAAVPINPENMEDLVSGLYKMYYDDVLRKELSVKGLERSKIFSWDRTFEIMLYAYKL